MASNYHGPINPNPADGEARIVIYGYVPSLALAIVGVLTYALVLAINAWYLVRKRSHRSFHALLVVGSLMECGGYAARIVSHRRPFLIGAFVGQYFLIVVAPVLFSAAFYLCLSLAVAAYPGTERILILRPKLVLAFFITIDCVTTVIQVAGAALIGASESAAVQGKPFGVTPDQANDILLAGLAIQTFSFLCFLVVLAVALYRATRPNFSTTPLGDTSISHTDDHTGESGHQSFRRLLWIMLVTSLLILLRTVFRLAETAQGVFGFASTHESLFGTLEYLPVILALAIWSGLPFSRFLARASSDTSVVEKPRGSNGLGPV